MKIYVVTIARAGRRDVTVYRTDSEAQIAIRERSEIGDTINLSACWLSD